MNIECNGSQPGCMGASRDVCELLIAMEKIEMPTKNETMNAKVLNDVIEKAF